MRKEISESEKQVWKKYIRHIHTWDDHNEIYTLSFSGYFEDGVPVYTCHQRTVRCICFNPVVLGLSPENMEGAECECLNVTWYMIYVEKENDWLYCINSLDSGWFWAYPDPKNDRYPTFDDWRFGSAKDFKVAFDKIDRLVSFIKEDENKELILLLTLSIRRSVHFPLEMVLHILSFIRGCEITSFYDTV